MDRKRQLLLLTTAIDAYLLLAIGISKRRRRKKRQAWTRSWISRRLEGRGLLTMLNEELLTEDPASYRNFLRMDNSSFEKLLSKVRNALTKQNTVMRECISVKSKLEATLRFTATGETYRSLMYSTRIHETTISKFIPVVCDAIYNNLKDEYLKTPVDENTWLMIAQQFEDLWQFPNCIGALDGRHIKFRPPASAGSYYYNYKGDHSIVLLGMVDANYRFTYFNVGVNGRVSDGGIFRECKLSKALSSNSLNFPFDRTLTGQTTKTPYVILADEAFPLSTRIMKPFPSRRLSKEQKVFNYRLSRARRMIESSFGILANRFRVLMNPINLSPEKVVKITLACISLHNFLASENSRSYIQMNELENTTSELQKIEQQGGNRATTTALHVRENFKLYFNSCFGRVEWQDNAILRNNM